MKRIPHDIIGTIAILKFPKKTSWITKKLSAWKFLRTQKNITTILEKTEKFSGRLRTPTTKHLAGIRTKETLYRENGCVFRLNIDETYFSPRLSNERKMIAKELETLTKRKKHLRVLVMFAGVAPFPIVIAKHLKKKSHIHITSSEINRKATNYAKQNVKLNNVQKNVTIIGGNSEHLPKKITEPFDVIIMTRPNLKNTFLQTTLKLTKKGTNIYYYGFGTKEHVRKEIETNTKNKIGNITLRKAGDIAPYEHRWLAKFKTTQ